MRKTIRAAAMTAAFGTLATLPFNATADRDDDRRYGATKESIQLGPRPFYLVDGMKPSPLKHKLMQCQNGPFRKSDFSIGHRGAALQFPEHTKESYVAAIRQGAGIVECDVTFTSDGALVCRHAENDLHTTTNILLTPLAQKCTKPFVPAVLDGDGKVITAASAECRASDLTLAEFKSLRGKMDAFNPAAQTPEQFVGGTASWRTDLYTGRGTLLTLRESIELNQRHDVKHTPELKSGDPSRIQAVFGGQRQYARKMAEEMHEAGVRPHDTWPQSFNVEDVFTWIDRTPYGKQAVYLLDYNAATNDIVIQAPYDKMDRSAYFKMLKKRGVQIIAPPIPALLAVRNGKVVPSALAYQLRKDFDIITWTLERSDLRAGASRAGYYYDFDPNGEAIKTDGDMYKALDVLAKDVKVLGIFSDWPATVTYYANCMNLK